MKLILKEDPKEWRKAAWMTALGLGLLSCLLRWRRVLPAGAWEMALGLLAGVAVVAALRPGLFRGYYRVSARGGFWISRTAGRAVLAVLFFILITPLGLVLRILGKDPLRLRRSGKAESYWLEARKESPLDRMF